MAFESSDESSPLSTASSSGSTSSIQTGGSVSKSSSTTTSTSSSRKRRRRRTRKQGNTATPSSILTDVVVGNTTSSMSTCADIIASAAPSHAEHSTRQSRFNGHRLRNLLRFHHDSAIKLDQVREAQWNTNKQAKSQLPITPRSFSDTSRNAPMSFPKDSMLDAILKTTSPPPTGRISHAPEAATLSPSSATSMSVVALPTILDGKNHQRHHVWPASTLFAPSSLSRVKCPLSRHASNPSSLAAITELARRYRYSSKVSQDAHLSPRDDAITSGQYGSSCVRGGNELCQISYVSSAAFASPSPANGSKLQARVKQTSRETIDSPNTASTLSDDEVKNVRSDVTAEPLQKKTMHSNCKGSVGPMQSLFNFLGRRFANSNTSTAGVKREARQAPSHVVVTTTPSTVDDSEELSIDSSCMADVNNRFAPGADFLLQLGHILGKSSYAMTTPIQYLANRCELRQSEEVGMMGVEKDDDQYTNSSLSTIAPRRIDPDSASRSKGVVKHSARAGKRKRGTSVVRLLLAAILISTGFFMMGVHYAILALGTIFFRNGIAHFIGNGRIGNRQVILDQSLSMTIGNEMGFQEDQTDLKCCLTEEKAGQEVDETHDAVDNTVRSSVAVSGDALHGLDSELPALILPIRRISTVEALAYKDESLSTMGNGSNLLAEEENFDEECKQETLATCTEAYDFTVGLYSYFCNDREEHIVAGLYFASEDTESNPLSLDEKEQSPNESVSNKRSPTPPHQHFGKRISFMPSRNASVGLRSARVGVESTCRGLVPNDNMPETGALVPCDRTRSSLFDGLSPETMFLASDDVAVLLNYQAFPPNKCSRRHHDHSTSEMFDIPLTQLLGQMIRDYRNKKQQKKSMRLLELNDMRILVDEAKGNSPRRRLGIFTSEVVNAIFPIEKILIGRKDKAKHLKWLGVSSQLLKSIVSRFTGSFAAMNEQETDTEKERRCTCSDRDPNSTRSRYIALYPPAAQRCYGD
mmetsp:Transcript_13568/g.29465  ORF Transcript_13568/g.29465 Transcript_13568/m.29465 type:complete len:982 (+) Transcript_13568:176-3121(+)